MADGVCVLVSVASGLKLLPNVLQQLEAMRCTTATNQPMLSASGLL